MGEAGEIRNSGSWTLVDVGVVGFGGGLDERFINSGTLAATGANASYLDGSVRLDNTGVISVSQGSLHVYGPVEQVSGPLLTDGTWIAANATLSLPTASLTTIGAGADVVLDGPTASFGEIAGLGSIAGSFTITGGKNYATVAALGNTGRLRVGPDSTLSVAGDFTTSGTIIFDLAGAPSSGLYGEIVGSGESALGGTAQIVVDPGYVPAISDQFTLTTFSNLTGTFSSVVGAAPAFTANYTATQFVLNGSGSLPVANAGPNLSVAEASPATTLVLDGSGSTDVDGTIVSYAWSATGGVVLGDSTTAQATYLAADDASFTATLEVCDDDSTCDTDATTVTVTNVNPVVAAGADQAVMLGEQVTLVVSFSDPGALDAHTATVDWGGGAIDAGLVTSGFSVSYTYPFAGNFTAMVCVTDDDLGSTCDSVDVTVSSPPNSPPVAVDDDLTVSQNSPHNVYVLANDTDPDPDPLTISSFDPVSTAGGTVDCSVVYWCVYTSPVGFVGTDTFTYTISDGNGGSDSATVTVTVVSNQLPAAADDSEIVRQDSPARTFDVLANDTDPDLDPLTISSFDPVSTAGGTVDCSVVYWCDYTPPLGFLGTDTFSYTVSDGRGGTDTATVTIEVVPNSAPLAVDDAFSGFSSNAPLAITVMVNDSDPDLDPLTVTSVSGPANGTAVVAAGGGFVNYSPDAGFIGTDTFTYTIADGAGGTDSATVTVEIRDYAEITNGVIKLGVWDRADLNIPTGVGLTYVPTGNESTSPGCACEGWGAADATSGVTGYANESRGTAGIEVVSFVKTASTAVSTVLIGGTLRVTHDYHPSSNPNLYEVSVTIENISGAAVDLRYRRVMDWDIEPTAFSEFVTLERGNAGNILFTSDDGFASADPLSARTSILFTGEAVDSGPADHGALFDFGFGMIDPSETIRFSTYYGAAATEVAALDALVDVGVEAYSLGQPSTTDGPTLGTPNTFVFGFMGVGGGSAFPTAEAAGPYNVIEGSTVQLDGTGSSVPGGTISSFSWSPTTGLDDPTSPTPIFTSVDNGTFDFTLTICDDQAPPRCDEDTTTVTVTNVDPQVNAGADQAVAEGDLVVLSVVFTDPGAVDTHTATVDWGDGSGPVSVGAVSSPFGVSHTYLAPGSFTVTACVTDDDDGIGCDTVTVEVNGTLNAPPDAVDDSYSMAEAGSRTFAVLINDSDPDFDSLSVSGFDAVSTNGGAVDCSGGFFCQYTSATGFVGTDTFGYTASDGTLTDSATVTITVMACPDLTGALGDHGIVTGQRWIACSAVDAHAARGADLTPVLSPVGPTLALLTSGDAALADGPNDSGGAGRGNGTSLRGANDVSILRVDLNIPIGATCLAFDVIFASEEYPEFVGSAFNDGFLAELDASTWSVSGATITAPGNFAFDSAGNVISINSSFFSPDRVQTDTGMQYDGATALLQAQTPITPGAHSLFLSIFDASDGSLDSAALVDNLRAFDGGAAGCAAGAGQAPTAVDDPDVSTDEDVAVDIIVLANDSDADGDPLTVVSVSDPANGTAVINPDGTISYTPDPDYFGTDTFTYTITDGHGGTDVATVTVTVNPVNDPPTAAIVGAATVAEGSSVGFDATGSADPDGTVVSYAWTVTSGVTLDDPLSPTPTLTGIDDAVVTVELTVTDDGGRIDTTTTIITVTNVDPTVVAGGDQAVNEGDLVVLSVVFTDPGIVDTHTATLDWGDGSALEMDGVVSSPFDVSHTYSSAGTYVVSVCVSDDDGGIGCDTVTIEVAGVAVCDPVLRTLSNGAPATDEGALAVLVDALGRFGTARTGEPGAVFNPAGAVGSASSTFSSDVFLSSVPGFLSACVTGATPVIVSESATQLVTRTVVGELTIVLTQTVSPIAGGEATLTQQYEITNTSAADVGLTAVRHLDGDLQFDSTLVDGGAARFGGAVLYEFDQADNPANPATYVGIEGSIGGRVIPDRWTIQPFNYTGAIIAAGAIPAADDGQISGDNNADGVTDNRYDVTLSQQWDANVAAGATVTFTTVTRFGRSVFDNAPVVTPGGPFDTVEGTPIELSVTVSDADDPVGPFSYSWTPTAALSGGSTATPTFTPADNGIYTFDVEVCDPANVCDTATVSVTVTNADPQVNAGADQSVNEGDLVVLSVVFTDPGIVDTHTATIDWGDGSGLVLVGAVSSPFGVSHTYSSAGTYVVSVCVTDDDGGTDCDMVNIDVVTPPQPPTAVIGGLATVAEGSSIGMTGTGSTDPDGTIVAYAWTVTAGATLNDATAPSPLLSGVDDATVTFELTVTDNDGQSDTTTTTVTVTNVNPTVSAGPDRGVQIGQVVTLTGTYADPGTLDTHTASIDWGDGVVTIGTVNQAANTVAGTHSYTAAGLYTVRLCVTDDDGGTGCDTFVVTVTAPPVLPVLTVVDNSIEEPATGQRNVTITVRLAGATTQPVTVSYRTIDGTAKAGPIAPDADYITTTGSVIFPASAATLQSLTFNVAVKPDLYSEPTETFLVELFGAANATIGDPMATVSIIDDGDICTIVGSAASETLIGTPGNDVICALGGNDLIVALGGVDRVFGDSGLDRIIYTNSPSPVVVDLRAGTGSGWGSETLDSIEQVVGSRFDDQLYGTDGANWMSGGDGDDTIVGRDGPDEIYGTNGADTINGGGANDELFGGFGNDRILGGDGSDTLIGSFGADWLYGEGGNDHLDGQDAADELFGGDGRDDLYGGNGNDRLYGGLGNDTLFGELGEDRLEGSEGADDIDGGADDDVLEGDAGRDDLHGGTGTDTMRGGADDDRLYGGSDRDLMYGGADDDRLEGQAGNDHMEGQAGNDVLSGGADNDDMYGGDGADHLAGGGGNDDLYGGSGNDRLDGGTGVNRLFAGSGRDFCSYGPPGETRDSCELP